MNIKNFSFTQLKTTPVVDGVVKLSEDLKIWINDDYYLIKKGFTTNFRSGGKITNLFLPKVSNETKAIAYVLHDALYTKIKNKTELKHLASKDYADELLISLLKFDNETIENRIENYESFSKYCKIKENREMYKSKIKLLKKDLLSGFKMLLIEIALTLFGDNAYNEDCTGVYSGNENLICWKKIGIDSDDIEFKRYRSYL